MNRLENFSIEELQAMYNGTSAGFRGFTQLNLQEADKKVFELHNEIEKEIQVRREAIEAEIERNTPRCECCNQRIEK